MNVDWIGHGNGKRCRPIPLIYRDVVDRKDRRIRVLDRRRGIGAERDAAELKIDEVRRSVHREDQTRMTGEMKGEIVADV